MVIFSEMYISQLIGIPVVDRIQDMVGTVKDIIISSEEGFPKVIGLFIITSEKKQERVILTGEIDMIGKQFVTTRAIKDNLVTVKPKPEDRLLWQDLMDRQILDIDGARVVRVNDLKLALMGQDVHLIAADVGLRGLLRRLGWEGFFVFLFGIFKKKVPETLIGWNYVEQIETGPDGTHIAIPTRRINDLHPADVANIMSQVRVDDRQAIFTALDEKTAAEALHELEPHIQAILLMTIDTKKALRILNRMPADEVADVLGDLPEEKEEELLRSMAQRKSEQVRKLLKHPEETAGGLMTNEFISVSKDATVEQVINRLREIAPDSETIYYIYAVDAEQKLAGVLSLRQLIISSSESLVSQIMKTDIITVLPDANKKKVADLISKYNLLALPIVDNAEKLLGIVTVDDVMDFILPPISRRKRHMLG